MKKIAALFFVFIFTLGAFAPKTAAQGHFNWEVGADFNVGLTEWSIPTGERTEKTIKLDGKSEPNDSNNNPGTDNRGNYTYSMGTRDMFTYGRGTWLRPNNLYLNIGYLRNLRDDVVEFHTRVLLDRLVRADLNQGTGANDMTGTHSFVMGTGRSLNWGDFIRYSFDEYYLRGNALFLTGYVGNTPNRGRVGDLNTLTEDVLRTVMVEHFGVNTPTADADFNENGQDINNFMSIQRLYFDRTPAREADAYVVAPYFMVGMRARTGRATNPGFPVFLQIAADPGNNSGIDGSDNYVKFNGAVRLSAEAIADRITLDAIYRFRGGDPNTMQSYDPDNTGGIIQPNGDGRAAHTFGLYANVLNVPGFDFAFGYSGYIVAYEDDKNTIPNPTGTITRSSPLFSGIDLRLRYTGIEKLIISSFNNISFASIDKPSATDEHFAMGVFGLPLPVDTTQSWFALYNALGFDYQLGDRLTASFQIANRYGAITTANASGDIVRSRNQMGGGGFIAFNINQFFLLQGGFAFRYLKDSYSNSASDAQTSASTRDASGGAFEIAVPIRLKLVFGKR